MCVIVCVCVCVCMFACVYLHVRACVRVRVCVCVSVRAGVRRDNPNCEAGSAGREVRIAHPSACVRACARACVRARAVHGLLRLITYRPGPGSGTWPDPVREAV